MDPQLLGFIENMMKAKLDEAEQHHRAEIHAREQDIRTRDEALQRGIQESHAREASLQAQLQDLTSQLVTAKMQLSGFVHVFSAYLILNSHLQDIKW